MDSPLIVAADREAAEAIENHEAWQSVHDRWQARTHRDLSPASFGHRILTFREQNNARLASAPTQTSSNPHPGQSSSSSGQHPPRNGQSSSHNSTPQLAAAPPHRTASNHSPPMLQPRVEAHSRSTSHSLTNGSHPILSAAPPQPQPAAHAPSAMPQLLHRDSSTSDHFKSDLARIDAAVVALQREMLVIRQELQRRPLHTDTSTLETLSETVHNMSAKAGEVDGLRFQVEVLKQRIKVLEETPGELNSKNTLAPIASMPSPAASRAQYAPPPHQQPPPATRPQSHTSAPSAVVTSAGWNAVNSTDPLIKRKVSDDLDDSAKRVRVDRPSLPSLSQAITGPSEVYTPQTSHVSEDSNQDGWHSQSNRGVGSGRGRGRPVGRPRHSTPADYSTPPWDGEEWPRQETSAVNGYYMYTSPSGDRGRLIRRGTGGTFTEEPGRRTRQKPTRNAQGILIRKDGKPDQRSISSAMNLKKVHARKLAELEGGDADSTRDDSATSKSPSAGTANLSVSSDPARASPELDIKPAQSLDRPARHSRTPSDPARRDSARRDPHNRVMQQMFPNGVGKDAQNANHAAHIFEQAEPDQRVQQRTQMVKEDTAAAASAPVSVTVEAKTEPPREAA